MNKYHPSDDYCYPGTSVLRNCLGIRDAQLLEAAEKEITDMAASNIEYADLPYNLSYLQQIHQVLFCDLYPWAGKLRTIDLTKGATRFCRVSFIETEAQKIFYRFAAQDYGREGSFNATVAILAKYYIEINMLHPFRDGNGRAQRVMFEHIAAYCGYEIDWRFVTREQWVDACISGVFCDYKPMERVFEICLLEV